MILAHVAVGKNIKSVVGRKLDVNLSPVQEYRSCQSMNTNQKPKVTASYVKLLSK